MNVRRPQTIETAALSIALAQAREPLPWAVRALLCQTRRGAAAGRTGVVVVPARNRPAQDALVVMRYGDFAALVDAALGAAARELIARLVNGRMQRPVGFAARTADERRAVASRGGRRSQRAGHGHQWTREQAAQAGRKSAEARASQRGSEVSA